MESSRTVHDVCARPGLDDRVNVCVEAFRRVERALIRRVTTELHIGGRSPVVEDVSPPKRFDGILGELLCQEKFVRLNRRRSVHDENNVYLQVV